MAAFDGKSAVVIDDDDTSIMVLKKMLEHVGIMVTVIRSTAEAGKQLQDIGRHDIIFLDLEMPSNNGYAVLPIIRSIPAFDTVAVIAYSTHTSHLNESKRAGFNGFLGKPLDSTLFSDQIARILRGEAVWEIP